ncbi:MAG: hypothetical protein ACXQTI_02480 [Candidatus Nezhaarchaeales archaeon]
MKCYTCKYYGMGKCKLGLELRPNCAFYKPSKMKAIGVKIRGQ